MKKNTEYSNFLLIILCVVLVSYFVPACKLFPARIFPNIDDLASRYVYSFSKKSVVPLRLIGVVIDDHSLNRIPSRWPWKRSFYARLIDILDKEKVKTVGFDFTFIGESENKEDDRIFEDALQRTRSHVVLGFLFDTKKAIPVYPLPQFKESAHALGLLNTPIDTDGKTRRLRVYIDSAGEIYYSFSVALAAEFLDKPPQEIASHIPFLNDRTFFIRYLIRPRDIIKISAYDILENLDTIKDKYGRDFLNGALVIVYPEAEIIHDTYMTPLGKIPGGILHMNGVADIILRRFVREFPAVTLLLLLLNLGLVYLTLNYYGFISGVFCALGVFILDFWLLILLNLKGIKYNYALVVVFGTLFFIVGSIYKYIYFLAQLLKIKDKATLDPSRNIFTLRYFFYRLGLEAKKIYFRKGLFLVFLRSAYFKENPQMRLEKTREVWHRVQSVITIKGSFWATYSQEELVGCVVCASDKIADLLDTLRKGVENSIGALWDKETAGTPKVQLGYIRLRKSYAVRELLFVLSSELKSSNQDVVALEEGALRHAPYAKEDTKDEFLKSFDEDIEEKNRQLFSLIENLRQEHEKTKEVFFSIISSFVNALEARDEYTEGHSQRVAEYSCAIAKRLGWEEGELVKLQRAGLLHDLGKIGIPDAILHKRGRLTAEEYTFIKRHSLIAMKILGPFEPLKEFSELVTWIVHHHERWDGSGYPHGLAGNSIPLASQILSLADVWDALTTGRDYKRAMTDEEAMQEIMRNKGTQFNADLVDVLAETIKARKDG